MSDREYYKKLRKKIKDVMTKSRYEHTLGVEFTAASLAMRYEVDIEKAELAGLLHDCAKCISHQKRLTVCKKNHIEITKTEEENPVLLHAKVGAFYAGKKYGIYDEDIINAILYHTTGRPDMGFLEKIIYVADLTSEDREYPDVKEVRELAEKSLDKTCLRGLSFTIEDNARKCRPIHIDTVKAYNYLAERINK